MRILAVSLLGLAMPICVYAADAGVVKQQAVVAETQNDTVEEHPVDIEGQDVLSVAPDKEQQQLVQRVRDLETSIQIIRDYNDDIVSIVAWSLSGLVATALVLIGFNWFQSNRSLSREFEALKKGLEQSLKNDSRQFEADLAERVGTLQEEILNNLGHSVDKATKPTFSNHKRAIDALKGRVANLEYDAEKLESESYAKNGSNAQAARAAGRMLKAALEINWDFLITNAIDQISSTIKGLDGSIGNELDTDDITTLEEVVSKVSDQYKTARTALLARLADLHAK